MYSQEEVRNKPKWRRSLLAASLLISPVAGVLMTSGAANAAEPVVAEITYDCASPENPFVVVDIDGFSGGDKFYVSIDGPGDDDYRYPESGDKSAGHIKGVNLFEGDVTAGLVYTVSVYQVGTPDVLVESETVTLCAPVVINCAYRFVTVVLPSKNGGGNPFQYDVELLDSLDAVVDSELNQNSGATVVLTANGPGTFTVKITRVQGSRNKITTYDVVVGSCPPPPPFNWNPMSVAPPIPKTGSDSTASLLILAPAMMALGGGLVLARRRMVKA